MNTRGAFAVFFVALGALSAGGQAAAAPPSGTHGAKNVQTAKVSAPRASAQQRSAPVAAQRSPARAAHGQPKRADAVHHSTAADLLSAAVISDKELAGDRGGTAVDNTSNATGTVSGNVASQLTTGSNTISQGSFSNTSGIPIVIQNTGNNVLIQNSTILNLQLTNPQAP